MVWFAAAFAAEIELRDEGRLSGEFIGLDAEGTMTMRSPFAESDLRLDVSKVMRVEYGFWKSDMELPDQRIYLVNGDVIAARIEYLDANELRLSSPYMGELQLPRAVVDAVQLGIVPEKPVIDGLGGVENWIGVGGEGNWKLENAVLSSSGNGVAARKLDLPDKYIIRYDLRWAGQPNFRMFFGDPMKPAGERVNRYSLHFGISGLSLKREMAEGGREATVALNNRSPEMYGDNKISLEIRVDGTTGRIHLYIDGNLLGKFRDAMTNLPDGDGILFVSQSQGSTRHFVSNFEITEWDDRGERHRSEERGDGDEDSLIGRNGERFGGSLQMVVDGEGGKVFRFKSDYQADPIDLPESEVSTVFFASPEDTKAHDSAEAMELMFAGDGRLAVKSCELGEDFFSLVHPFLGKINLKRDVVGSMERRKIPKAKQEKDQ